MLDVNLIRKDPELVKKGIVTKNADPKLVDDFLVLDERWRDLNKKVDDLRAQLNALSKERKAEEAKKVKVQIRSVEEELRRAERGREEVLWQIPNLPLPDVPIGKDASGNKVLREVGETTKFDFQPRDYLEITQKLDLIDIERSAKISGSRFSYLKNQVVLLEFAIIKFVLDILTNKEILGSIADKIEKGYSSKPFVPVLPPAMLRPDILKKMARLYPGDEEERYYLPKDDLYLAGSAEHTLGPMHMDEIIPEDKFPLRYIGFSTSFRREAGSYGKDVRGIFRVHQFDKLEIESFTLPEHSIKEQDFIVAIQEYLMRALAIPYRAVAICTGDTGKPDARQIDIEAWIPSEKRYRETHTSDLMTDYQARRLNTRVKRKNGETQFVHMNDATAFAIGRILIAIIENYQTQEGAIKVPAVLVKFTGFEEIKS